MTTIYIVRHGQSLGNAHYAQNETQFVSTSELGSALSDLGVQQVRDIAAKLRSIHFDAIFSSDFTRAVQTAEIIALERKMEVITTKLIRERNLGSMEGKMTKAANEQVKQLQQGLSDEEKMSIKLVPDMENEAEIVKRFLTFLREVTLAYQGKTILVANHGHMMRSLLLHLGFAKYDKLPSGSIKNTGYIKLESDGVEFIVKETWGVEKKSE